MGTVPVREKFGLLLRRTREGKKQSLGAAARHLGFSVPYLSDVELGRRLPLSSDQIIKLCVFLDVEPTPLLMAAIESRNEVGFAAPKSVAGREAVAALQRKNGDLSEEQWMAIMRILGKEGRVRPFGGIRVDARRLVEIESAAYQARRGIAPRVTDRSPIDAMFALERLGHTTARVFNWEYRVRYGVARDLEPEVLAETRCSSDSSSPTIDIVLSEETYDGLENGDVEAAFTVFHEFGHLHLHRQQIVRMARMPHHHGLARTAPAARQGECSEFQAESYARAFAVPVPALIDLDERGELTASNVQRIFRVPPSAANVRVETFQLNRAEFYRAFQRFSGPTATPEGPRRRPM